MMYKEEDLTAVREQRKRRWIVLSVPLAVLVAVIVVSLVKRVEWLTSGVTILAGVVLIAGYDLFIKPLSAYAVHVNNMLHGRRHEEQLAFDRFSEDISLVDGVRYYAMTAIDYDEKNKPFERLFYYDAAKELPDFRKGDMLRILCHDREIADVTRLEAPNA